MEFSYFRQTLIITRAYYNLPDSTNMLKTLRIGELLTYQLGEDSRTYHLLRTNH